MKLATAIATILANCSTVILALGLIGTAVGLQFTADEKTYKIYKLFVLSEIVALLGLISAMTLILITAI